MQMAADSTATAPDVSASFLKLSERSFLCRDKVYLLIFIQLEQYLAAANFLFLMDWREIQ